MNPDACFNARSFANNGSSFISPMISDQISAIQSDLLHTDSNRVRNWLLCPVALWAATHKTWFVCPWNNLVVQVNVNLSPFLRYLKLLQVLLLFTRKWKTELTVSVFHESILNEKNYCFWQAPASRYLELFLVLISNRKLRIWKMNTGLFWKTARKNLNIETHIK